MTDLFGGALPDAPRRLVASFVCWCGCQDEVREPAPASVVCWGKGCGLDMRRWVPGYLPPVQSARLATPDEAARIGR